MWKYPSLIITFKATLPAAGRLTADPLGVGVVNFEVFSEEVRDRQLALESQVVVFTCEGENSGLKKISFCLR